MRWLWFSLFVLLTLTGCGFVADLVKSDTGQMLLEKGSGAAEIAAAFLPPPWNTFATLFGTLLGGWVVGESGRGAVRSLKNSAPGKLFGSAKQSPPV